MWYPQEIQAIEDKLTVKALLKCLSPSRSYVVERRWGLYGQPAQAQQEIGQMLGVSASRVHQIEHEALRILRQKVRKRGHR